MSGKFPKPIIVNCTPMRHESGMEEYYVRVVSCGGRHVIATSWSKIGGVVRCQIETYEGLLADAITGAFKIAKKARGYRVSAGAEEPREASNKKELLGIVGLAVFGKLEDFLNDGGQTCIEWLLETAGAPEGAKLSRRAKEEAPLGDDLKALLDEPEHPAKKREREAAEARARVDAKRAANRAEKERQAREREEAEAFYKNNADWGLF